MEGGHLEPLNLDQNLNKVDSFSVGPTHVCHNLKSTGYALVESQPDLKFLDVLAKSSSGFVKSGDSFFNLNSASFYHVDDIASMELHSLDSMNLATRALVIFGEANPTSSVGDSILSSPIHVNPTQNQYIHNMQLGSAFKNLARNGGIVEVPSPRVFSRWADNHVGDLEDDDLGMEGEFSLAQWNLEVSSSSSNATSRIAHDAVMVYVVRSPRDSPSGVVSRLKSSKGCRGKKHASIHKIMGLAFPPPAECSIHDSDIANRNQAFLDGS